MKKLWKRIPKQGKIALDLLLIVGILYLAWWKLGYPMPTAEAAFRKAQREALLPGSMELEAFVTNDGYDGNHGLGLSCDGSTACSAWLSHGTGWKGSGARVYKPIEGAFLVPMESVPPTDLISLAGTQFLAVKVPGAASIRVSTELDEMKYEMDKESGQYAFCPGGTYHMEVEEADNGWFIARLSSEIAPRDPFSLGVTSDPEFFNYFFWIYAVSERVRDSNPYRQSDFSGRFRVEALDETGAVIKTVTWDPLAH